MHEIPRLDFRKVSFVQTTQLTEILCSNCYRVFHENGSLHYIPVNSGIDRCVYYKRIHWGNSFHETSSIFRHFPNNHYTFQTKRIYKDIYDNSFSHSKRKKLKFPPANNYYRDFQQQKSFKEVNIYSPLLFNFVINYILKYMYYVCNKYIF